jgi:hypothetical protein
VAVGFRKVVQDMKFDKTVSVNRAIKKAWKDAETATEFENAVMEIFRVQQFFTWDVFRVLVEDLTGYKF